MTTPARVVALNKRLADRLCNRGGILPRWQWMYAPDMPYWSRMLGKVWVIAQWFPNGMTEAEWRAQFGDAYPYATHGSYQAMPATQLPAGMLPTEAITQEWIWHIYRQQSKTPWTIYAEVMAGVQVNLERNQTEWWDFVHETEPAFSNYAAGKRGYHVSYGGMEEQDNGSNSIGAFRTSEGRSAVRAAVRDTGPGQTERDAAPVDDPGRCPSGAGAVRDEPDTGRAQHN